MYSIYIGIAIYQDNMANCFNILNPIYGPSNSWISFLRFPSPHPKATERGRRRAGARDFVGQQGRVGAPRRWKTDVFSCLKRRSSMKTLVETLVRKVAVWFELQIQIRSFFSGICPIKNMNCLWQVWFSKKEHEIIPSRPKIKSLVKYLARKEW